MSANQEVVTQPTEKEETAQAIPEKKKKNYISSREFFNCIMDARIKGYITNELAGMFMLLSERNANHRKFVRYHHIRQDLISVSNLACVKGFPKFRPYKDKERLWDGVSPIEYDHEVCSNIFSFFTTCIHNALKQHLKDEYNQSNINNKMRLQMGMAASDGYCDMIKEKEEEGEEDDLTDDEQDIHLHDVYVEGMSVWDDYHADDESIVDYHTSDEEEEEI